MEERSFLPNRFVRITLEALQEVVGGGAMKAIYHHAGIPDLGENPPTDNMNCEFASEDFANMFNSLNDVMGQRGGRTLSVRAGRTTMKLSGMHFGTSPLPAIPTYQATDTDPLLIRLNRLSNFLNSISDLRTLVCRREGQEGYEFLIRQCPNCCNLKSDEPLCGFFVGFIDEAVKEFSSSDFYKVAEIECQAVGAPGCKFLIIPAAQEQETSLTPDQL